MATFFVGQRVRIKWSCGWPELSGSEGRVVELGRTITVGPNAGISGVTVAPDIWGSEIAPHESLHGARRFTPLHEQLEPIQPSGHRAGDYSLSELLDRCRAGEGVPA